MPIYEYECEKGHKFEELHKVDERLPVACHTCGSDCHIVISKTCLPNFRIAHPLRYFARDGTVYGNLPDSNVVERPPALPEWSYT